MFGPCVETIQNLCPMYKMIGNEHGDDNAVALRSIYVVEQQQEGCANSRPSWCFDPYRYQLLSINHDDIRAPSENADLA